MGRPSRYSPELRERAIRLVQEQAAEHPSQWAAIESIATKVGCTAETLRKWVRQAERDRPARRVDDGGAPAVQGIGARESRAEAHQRDLAESVRVFCPGGARPRAK